MVEVNLGMKLSALLVHLIMLGGFILFLGVEAGRVRALGLPLFRSAIEQGLGALVDIATLCEEIRVNVGQKARVLLGSRSV